MRGSETPSAVVRSRRPSSGLRRAVAADRDGTMEPGNGDGVRDSMVSPFAAAAPDRQATLAVMALATFSFVFISSVGSRLDDAERALYSRRADTFCRWLGCVDSPNGARHAKTREPRPRERSGPSMSTPNCEGFSRWLPR